MPASSDGAGGSVPARTDVDVRFDLTLLRGFLIVLATAADAVTDVKSFAIFTAATAGAKKTAGPETAVSVSVGLLGFGVPVDAPNSGVTGMISGSDCRTDACIAAMGVNVADTCGVGDATTELGSALD